MSKMKFAFLLALAPVMMGSDYSEDEIAQNLSALTVTGKLPVCKTGEFLTYQGGSLVCAIPPGNGISGLTKCEGQLITNTGAGGEFKTLSCTPKGSASISSTDINRVNTLKTNVDTLSTTVNNLTVASPSRGYYFGLSTVQPANAMLFVAGNDYGAASGNALCKSTARPKAHICTVYEIYASVAAGKNMSTLAGVNAWVYNSSWNKVAVNPADADRGIAESCGGFVYSSNDTAWQGTMVSYNATGPVLSFRNTLCNSGLKVACCD
jgi:hypothetical protein